MISKFDFHTIAPALVYMKAKNVCNRQNARLNDLMENDSLNSSPVTNAESKINEMN